MLSISHILISGTAVSLFLMTADPSVITVGAIAGMLPDVDVSTSFAGRIFPWISEFLESRMPHRSCTHSLVASISVALVTYIVTFWWTDMRIFAHAIVIGYSFGWFADVFTKSGVEMFWPSPVRCVCPGNRNLRLRTGSSSEYVLLIILITLALSVFSINIHGGLLIQFDRLLAVPAGVEHIYNEQGSTHQIIANIRGVMAGNRAKIQGKFLIVQPQGLGFIVRELSTQKIYKASLAGDKAQIVIEKITADVGEPAITHIETIFLDDQLIGRALDKFSHQQTTLFISGHLQVENFDISDLPYDSQQFPYLQATSNSINLEFAPLEVIQKFCGNEYATGQLEIRSIHHV